MKYEMRPVISIGTLEKALEEKGIVLHNELANILFGDAYQNYSYKTYYFMHIYDPDNLSSWQNREDILIQNEVNTMLQALLPDHTSILLDVSW